MKLLDWTEVSLIVKTMVENKININDIGVNDLYSIEKVTDIIFSEVRKKQLQNE
jgi:hypothetical protein